MLSKFQNDQYPDPDSNNRLSIQEKLAKLQVSIRDFIIQVKLEKDRIEAEQQCHLESPEFELAESQLEKDFEKYFQLLKNRNRTEDIIFNGEESDLLHDKEDLQAAWEELLSSATLIMPETDFDQHLKDLDKVLTHAVKQYRCLAGSVLDNEIEKILQDRQGKDNDLLNTIEATERFLEQAMARLVVTLSQEQKRDKAKRFLIIRIRSQMLIAYLEVEHKFVAEILSAMPPQIEARYLTDDVQNLEKQMRNQLKEGMHLEEVMSHLSEAVQRQRTQRMRDLPEDVWHLATMQRQNQKIYHLAKEMQPRWEAILDLAAKPHSIERIQLQILDMRYLTEKMQQLTEDMWVNQQIEEICRLAEEMRHLPELNHLKEQIRLLIEKIQPQVKDLRLQVTHMRSLTEMMQHLIDEMRSQGEEMKRMSNNVKVSPRAMANSRISGEMPYPEAKKHINILSSLGNFVNAIIRPSKLPEKVWNSQTLVSYPRLLSKRFSSSIFVSVYPDSQSGQADVEIQTRLRSIGKRSRDYTSRVSSIKIKTGSTLRIQIESPGIQFSLPVVMQFAGELASTTFTAKPEDDCVVGKQMAKLSICDNETNTELMYILFEIKVIDFLFDHVSRPFLLNIGAVFTGIGSLIIFTLTIVGKVDLILGVASGTTAGLFAFTIYSYFLNLFKWAQRTS